MSKFEIPPDLLPFLLGSEGRVMSVGEYLEHLRANPDWVDCPIVDRVLDVVISRPYSHKGSVALLSVCHEGEHLLKKEDDFWMGKLIACQNDDRLWDSLVEKFLKKYGYFFTSAESIIGNHNPTLRCLLGRHMDECDGEIVTLLRCRETDYSYDD